MMRFSVSFPSQFPSALSSYCTFILLYLGYPGQTQQLNLKSWRKHIFWVSKYCKNLAYIYTELSDTQTKMSAGVFLSGETSPQCQKKKHFHFSFHTLPFLYSMLTYKGLADLKMQCSDVEKMFYDSRFLSYSVWFFLILKGLQEAGRAESASLLPETYFNIL